MQNVRECQCIQNNLRNHHGVVCTSCNPELIDPFIVPESIKAYRVWRFTIQNGFHASGGWRRNRTWSDFNDVLPPGFGSEHDFMKPWSGKASCRNYDHSAPNPYCSCGYYSIKKFAEVTSGNFGHDGSDNLLKHYNNLFGRLSQKPQQEQELVAELFFNSPVVKTLEMKEFVLLAEVALKGVIIECEKGYRSQSVEPEKFYLLLQFEILMGICRYLGEILNKDEAAIFHAAYEWSVYIDNYLTNMLKVYGHDFELRFKFYDSQLDNYERLTGNQTKGSEYLPFKDHPVIYPQVRLISQVISEDNRLLNYKLPSLRILQEKALKGNENLVYLDDIKNQRNSRTRQDRQRREGFVDFFNHFRRESLAEFLPLYFEYLLSFAHFNVMLSEQSNEKGHLLAYPNLTHIFGFRYHGYLERKYSAQYALNISFIPNEHPSHWLKEMYPYFKKYLSIIGKNSQENNINFTENEIEKGKTWR